MSGVARAATLLGLRPQLAPHAVTALTEQAARLELSVDRLIDRAAGGDDDAMGVVAAALTVCETYFLRHPEDFATVQEHAERRAAAGHPVLRVWSVGCATGEEAWTLAGVLSSVSPTVQVVGSDINPRSLAWARQGRYGRSSLRSKVSVSWLKETTDGWDVSPALKGNVSFSIANVAALPLAPSRLGGSPDVIFCRNLLMYLDPVVAERVVAHLASLLGEGGLLVLGMLEGPHAELVGFERVSFPFSNAWVRGVVAPRSRPMAAPPAPVRDVGALLRHARRLANEGRLAEALSALDPSSREPALLYLRGCVLLERDQPEAAEATFRHVLGLAAGHVLARLQVLLSAVSRRDATVAEVERRELEAALSALPDEARLDDEGVTAGYVRRLLQGL